MPKNSTNTAADIKALAEFRYTLRRFLRFSEDAASKAGLTPQQHQLLLQIAGAPDGTPVTVGYLSERLSLRHHSVVELSGRCSEAGLLTRDRDSADGRVVVLTLTRSGAAVLHRLSENHARELNELGTQLIENLQAILQ